MIDYPYTIIFIVVDLSPFTDSDYTSGCPVSVKHAEAGRLTVNNPCAVKSSYV